MLAKISGLAGALSIILAILAALIAIPNLDVSLVLVVLGLIAGVGIAAERIVGFLVAVLAYPALGAALGLLPMVGEKLNAIPEIWPWEPPVRPLQPWRSISSARSRPSCSASPSS
jgi:hypothetical protein